MTQNQLEGTIVFNIGESQNPVELQWNAVILLVGENLR